MMSQDIVTTQHPFLGGPLLRMFLMNLLSKLPQNIALELTTYCLAPWDKFFVDNTFDIKNNQHWFHGGPNLVHFFNLSEFVDFHWDNCCFVSGYTNKSLLHQQHWAGKQNFDIHSTLLAPCTHELNVLFDQLLADGT